MDNQKKLNELVSVHLGKAGDGSVVKPYVTPDEVDPSLLVGVPRQLNRTQYDLDDGNLPFVGYDVWNGYEFSTLLTSGFPVSGWVKFSYSSSTPFIVESKSVKLYLNSFNMAKIIETEKDIEVIETKIKNDIGEVVQGDVDVRVFIDPKETKEPFKKPFYSIEKLVDVENIKFDRYNESEDILKIIPMGECPLKGYYRSYSLRSNCRVTNQPDWGDVYIYIKGAMTVSLESLLQYIVSMRKENHFHEEICECIYKRLHDLLSPIELFVGCLYTRRGGIDINPIRATSMETVKAVSNIHNVNRPSTKTARQ